jgi:hypothetical protein
MDALTWSAFIDNGKNTPPTFFNNPNATGVVLRWSICLLLWAAVGRVWSAPVFAFGCPLFRFPKHSGQPIPVAPIHIKEMIHG